MYPSTCSKDSLCWTLFSLELPLQVFLHLLVLSLLLRPIRDTQKGSKD